MIEREHSARAWSVPPHRHAIGDGRAGPRWAGANMTAPRARGRTLHVWARSDWLGARSEHIAYGYSFGVRRSKRSFATAQ